MKVLCNTGSPNLVDSTFCYISRRFCVTLSARRLAKLIGFSRYSPVLLDKM